MLFCLLLARGGSHWSHVSQEELLWRLIPDGAVRKKGLLQAKVRCGPRWRPPLPRFFRLPFLPSPEAQPETEKVPEDLLEEAKSQSLRHGTVGGLEEPRAFEAGAEAEEAAEAAEAAEAEPAPSTALSTAEEARAKGPADREPCADKSADKAIAKCRSCWEAPAVHSAETLLLATVGLGGWRLELLQRSAVCRARPSCAAASTCETFQLSRSLVTG